MLLICKFRQYKVVIIANFVYYRKTQLEYTVTLGNGGGGSISKHHHSQALDNAPTAADA